MDLSSHVSKFQQSFTSEEWFEWKELFETYLEIKAKTNSSKRLAYLKIIGGTELIQFLKDLPLSSSAEPLDEYSDAINRIDGYFSQVKNPLKDRYDFRTMTQRHNEKIKDFVLRLRN